MDTWLTQWEPENPEFWQKTGRKIAWQTLAVTTFALMLSFATWYMMSAIVVRIPQIGFKFRIRQPHHGIAALREPAVAPDDFDQVGAYGEQVFAGEQAAEEQETVSLPALAQCVRVLQKRCGVFEKGWHGRVRWGHGMDTTVVEHGRHRLV